MSHINQVMGTAEAAEKWGLSQGYIKNLCTAGKIPARKIGREWVMDCDTPSPKIKSNSCPHCGQLQICDECVAKNDEPLRHRTL